MASRRTRSALAALALAALCGGATHAGAQVEPALSGEVAALERAAREKLELREVPEAIKLFKKAIKAAGNRCAPCQLGLAQAYNSLGAYKDAVASAELALRLSQDPTLLAVAWNQMALAQFAAAGKELEKLRVAESSFRQVIAYSDDPMARFNLGTTLLRQGRDEDGLAELHKFLELAPRSPKAETARDLIENPRRARENLLPSLELVTLAGEFLTNEDLAGKVVLFDFWGTWCAPCRASIPSLKALVARSTEQPLVVISVANDSDEAVLKSFIADHGMSWPQVWDKEKRFVREMGVTGYPTYLLADHEGTIVFRYSGWSDAVERAIQSEVRRAVGRAKRADPAP